MSFTKVDGPESGSRAHVEHAFDRELLLVRRRQAQLPIQGEEEKLVLKVYNVEVQKWNPKS